MEITYIKLIVLCSCVCLCVRLCVSQAPPARVGNNRRQDGGAPPAGQVGGMCPPGSCPPQWISLLQMYSHILNDNIMQPVCTVALKEGFISACNTPQKTCGNHRPGAQFCCCPAQQLSKVQICLPQTQYVCIPDNFEPWQAELQKAIFGMMG